MQARRLLGSRGCERSISAITSRSCESSRAAWPNWSTSIHRSIPGDGRRSTRLRTVRDDNGDRVGFQGKRYRSEPLSRSQFHDQFDDFLAFLEPRLIEIKRILSDSGSLYFHIDYREVHYCKVLLDQIFGRDCFLNEIIWAYDYGGRPKRRWPAKHDNILLYVKDPQRYTFNRDDIDRIPYMAPGLVGPEKAAKGKLPTDTWWHTIVAPGSKERTGLSDAEAGAPDRADRAGVELGGRRSCWTASPDRAPRGPSAPASIAGFS